MSERQCHYCGQSEKEMRPYGPGGSWVCFPCATETPEREAVMEAAFASLLEGNAAISPSGVVAIGTEEGPIPFDPTDARRG